MQGSSILTAPVVGYSLATVLTGRFIPTPLLDTCLAVDAPVVSNQSAHETASHLRP